MRTPGFIEPMECQASDKVPQGPGWLYEIKLDGYRMVAVRGVKLELYSRLKNSTTKKFPQVAEALDSLPEGTVIDGELVALNAEGKPDFNLMQNYKSAEFLVYFVFDIPMHEGRSLLDLPLTERRRIMREVVKPNDCIQIVEVSTSAEDIIRFVKEHHLEGVIAKRAASKYLPGKRTGLWLKTRFNMTQEFVIGGYTPSHLGLDAIIVGVYRGKDLYFSSRVRAGFTPVTRRQVYQKIHKLETDRCPFVNLPQPTAGRWGLGITAEAMKGMVWLRPETVAQVEFLEWTGGDILRSASFVRLREDKDPRKVVKETSRLSV